NEVQIVPTDAAAVKPRQFKPSAHRVMSRLAGAKYPLSETVIMRRLGATEADLPALRKILAGLEARLAIIKMSGGYTLLDPERLIEGTVRGLRSGAGFLIPDDLSKPDGFVTAES